MFVEAREKARSKAKKEWNDGAGTSRDKQLTGSISSFAVFFYFLFCFALFVVLFIFGKYSLF